MQIEEGNLRVTVRDDMGAEDEAKLRTALRDVQASPHAWLLLPSSAVVEVLPGMLHDELVASLMFDAYNEHGPNPWRTFDGREVPRWPDLTDEVRAKWTAAAAAARAALGGGR